MCACRSGREIHLPADSVATIDSAGLLGDKFVKLIPGKSTKILPTDGSGVITNTKTYKSLEQQVGEIIFLATDLGKPSNGEGTGSGGGGTGAAPAPAPSPAPAPNAPAAGEGAKKP